MLFNLIASCYAVTVSSVTWKDCSVNSLVKINNVQFSPNPPAVGDDVIQTVIGTQSADVVEGATAHLEVKWNDKIVLLKKDFNVCDERRAAGLPCPIPAGQVEYKKGTLIPNNAPAGTYVGTSVVKNADGAQVFCVQQFFTISK